jgi:hypothetical protein
LRAVRAVVRKKAETLSWLSFLSCAATDVDASARLPIAHVAKNESFDDRGESSRVGTIQLPIPANGSFSLYRSK